MTIITTPITMIVTDLDGTLLNKNKEVTQKTRMALHELKNRGIILGLASGRSVQASLQFLSQWGIENDLSFLIGMNGSTFYDVRQKIQEDYYMLSGETILEITKHFEGIDVTFFAMQGNNRYVNRSTEQSRVLATKLRENEIVVDYATFMKGKKFNKLILVTPPEKMKEICKVSATFHSEQYIGIQTEPHLFEYFDSRINKGVGVKKVCEHFGVQLEHVVAFGDSLNDKEMLQEVGLGIAMANAHDEIKKIADHISPYTNEEDALANFIHDFLETKNPARLDVDANSKWKQKNK